MKQPTPSDKPPNDPIQPHEALVGHLFCTGLLPEDNDWWEQRGLYATALTKTLEKDATLRQSIGTV